MSSYFASFSNLPIFLYPPSGFTWYLPFFLRRLLGESCLYEIMSRKLTEHLVKHIKKKKFKEAWVPDGHHTGNLLIYSFYQLLSQVTLEFISKEKERERDSWFQWHSSRLELPPRSTSGSKAGVEFDCLLGSWEVFSYSDNAFYVWKSNALLTHWLFTTTLRINIIPFLQRTN